jgi:hypothetical protein
VLGAFAGDDDDLRKPAVATIRSVTKAADETGCVPAVIRPDEGLWDWAEGGAVDASAWYVIMAGAAWEATENLELAKETWESVEGALRWLGAQDATGTGLISAAPATDWMDSSLVRSGRTLHLNVLYSWSARAGEIVAEALGKTAPVDSADIRWRTNALFWPDAQTDIADLHPRGLMHSAIKESYKTLAAQPRSHYVSHVIHAGFIDRCDTLGNVLAVLSGVALEDKAQRVLGFLSEAEVDLPYPSRAWDEPIPEGSHMWFKEAEATMNPRWRNAPHCYHNGGVWPYIGALHAAAAASIGLHQSALPLLHETAQANQAGDWRFSEWLHGETGEPRGASSQAWNAGALLLAATVADQGPGRIPARP